MKFYAIYFPPGFLCASLGNSAAQDDKNTQPLLFVSGIPWKWDWKSLLREIPCQDQPRQDVHRPRML
jgi:hypothetical protein